MLPVYANIQLRCFLDSPAIVMFYRCSIFTINVYTPYNILRIYSINLNEIEILVNSMCFLVLFHNPFNDCMNLKKYEY